MTTDALTVQGVTRRFGTTVANDGITMRVRAGEVVGLLGHNGAGKTTLVSQVVGLLRPDEGTIHVAGVDAVAHPAAARRHVALHPQGQVPLDGLTPRTAIEIAGRLRGLDARAARAAAVAVADELGIGPWLDRRALPDGGGISGGVRRLTGFAMAVVAPTSLVVLDEPTNDVDAARRRLLWGIVRRLGDEGRGVLLVTHNVVEAERVVDDLVILDHGRVVAAGSPARLRGTTGDELRLEVRLRPDGTDPTSGAPDGARTEVPLRVTRRVRDGRRVLLTVPGDEAAAAVAWADDLHRRDVVEGYALAPASLEEAYLAVTTTRSATPDTESTRPTDRTTTPTETEEPARA